MSKLPEVIPQVKSPPKVEEKAPKMDPMEPVVKAFTDTPTLRDDLNSLMMEVELQGSIQKDIQQVLITMSKEQQESEDRILEAMEKQTEALSELLRRTVDMEKLLKQLAGKKSSESKLVQAIEREVAYRPPQQTGRISQTQLPKPTEEPKKPKSALGGVR